MVFEKVCNVRSAIQTLDEHLGLYEMKTKICLATPTGFVGRGGAGGVVAGSGGGVNLRTFGDLVFRGRIDGAAAVEIDGHVFNS